MKELGIDRPRMRRSRRVATRQGIPAKLWWEVVSGGHFTCHWCGRRAGPSVKLEVDHIVPVSKGGTDDRWNLVPACRECNRSKGNQLLDEGVDREALDKLMESLGLKGSRVRGMAGTVPACPSAASEVMIVYLSGNLEPGGGRINGVRIARGEILELNAIHHA